MKRAKQIGLMVLMGISTVMINGCTKDGATGPAGANGISGTNGTQGTAGTNGTNGTQGTAGTNGTNGTNGSIGATGNANVQVINFTVSTWTLNGQTWSYTYPSTINGNGAVMVYINNSGVYWALPFTTQDIELSFQASTSQLAIFVLSASGTTAISNPGTMAFKAVTIPPAMKVLHPNTNWQNYSEVKSILNLPD